MVLRWNAVALMLTAALAATATPALAAQVRDPLSRAREAYNAGAFDAAIAAADEVGARTPAAAASAALVRGRARLERYRVSGEAAELERAHADFDGIDPLTLSDIEEQDYLLGLGILVYYDGRPGAAAELLDGLMARVGERGGAAPALGARRTLFDWWATATDRAAQLAPDAARADFYTRIVRRAEAELAADPHASAPGYWLAAALRGAGDIDRAWHAAIAAWIRTRLLPDKMTARADLDLLVETAIIPERARLLAASNAPDTQSRDAIAAAMRAEWEKIKAEGKRQKAETETSDFTSNFVRCSGKSEILRARGILTS
jgi:hypothetical protein